MATSILHSYNPKKSSDAKKQAPETSKILFDDVPTGDFTILETTNRYKGNAYVKPLIQKTQVSSTQQELAKRTFVIIINGGINKMVNRERYWNDCSFLYQTLVNTYAIPKENIYPLMSDGNDPAEDMISADLSHYYSQSLDLDFDGENEIELAATKVNIRNVFQHLQTKINKDDHLFVFVIDHGGCDKLTNKITNETRYYDSYICLWGDSKDSTTKLYNYELAELLSPFSNRLANVNVTLGQCHSGGFIDSLSSLKCVVATACQKEQSSYSCSDVPYDEFVYHWISAINGAYPDGTAIKADKDNNQHITMEEAFEYAQSNDRKRETPQYFSFPTSTGEDLAFSKLPTAVDLFIADSPSDTGKEPYNASTNYWCSPDIWMRINNDSIQQHENPIFETGHHYAYIYVKVQNRGKGDGGGKWLHLYWAYSSTGISDKTWNGKEIYNRLPTGGYFPPQRIGTIASGDSKILLFKWDISPTSTDIGLPKKKQHICFYAKILDTATEYGFVPGKTFFTPKENNNEAQRSIAVIDDKCLSTYADILVPNVYDSRHTYSLEFIPSSPYSANFFANGYIEMSLPKNTDYDLAKSDGVREIDTPTTSMPNGKRLAFRSIPSRLVGLNISPQEILQLGIKFNITNLSCLNTADTISFNLIQRDELNKIIGAVTYIIPPLPLAISQISVSSENLSDGCVKLSAKMEDLQHISWYDENEICIGESAVMTLPAIKESKQILAVGSNSSGELTSGTILLTPSYGIEDVHSIDNGIRVSLYGETIDGSELTVTSSLDGALRATKLLSSQENEIDFNLSPSPSEIFIISYNVNGQTIDTTKFFYPNE